jgi:SAM-dependent methyltransferase
MLSIVKNKVVSKGWDWSQISDGYWTEAADEFLPVAMRWKKLNVKTVLDIGCGRGRHTLFLAGLGFDVTATDISPEGIEQLNEKARERKLESKIKTLVCDMLELPFRDKSFDGVLGFHSVYHTDYVGLKTLIAKITDFLKENGQLYITFNSKCNPSFRASDNEVIDDYTVIRHFGREEGIPHTFLDYDDIIGLLADCKILKIQQIQDYYDKRTSIHFFVEAEKKRRKQK